MDATFRRLVAACFLNQLGFQAAYFVGIIGCATYVLDAGAAEVSALVFVMNVVMLVGYSAAGALIDAVGPKIVLVASLALSLVAAAVVLAMPVCMVSLLVVAIVMGLAGAAASTAVETFPRYLTSDESLLTRVNSLNSVATFVAVIAGPLFAGAIAGVTDNRLVFAVLPVTSVLGVLVALCLRERVRPEHPQDSGQTTSSLLARVADGVRATVANPALIVLFAVCFLGNLGFGAFDSLESLFYRDVLRVGAEWMGWLTAIVGVGATVGSLLAGRVPTRHVTLPALCGLLVVEGLGGGALHGDAARMVRRRRAARPWRRERPDHAPARDAHPAQLRADPPWQRERAHARGHQRVGHAAVARGAVARGCVWRAGGARLGCCPRRAYGRCAGGRGQMHARELGRAALTPNCYRTDTNGRSAAVSAQPAIE